MSQYQVKAGPEAFLPPAAASMGIVLPDPGECHIEGRITSEEEGYELRLAVLSICRSLARLIGKTVSPP